MEPSSTWRWRGFGSSSLTRAFTRPTAAWSNSANSSPAIFYGSSRNCWLAVNGTKTPGGTRTPDNSGPAAHSLSLVALRDAR